MKALGLTLAMALVPSVGSATLPFKEAVTQADQIVSSEKQGEVEYGIQAITKVDDYAAKALTPIRIKEIAHAVAVASDVTGVDWKIILSVMYVESRICHPSWLKGDKHFENYRSLGCMQVNKKFWGEELKKAGIFHQDLLEHDVGIIVGSVILKQRIDRYGVALGIKRYNGSGPATEEYYKKVMQAYGWLNIGDDWS